MTGIVFATMLTLTSGYINLPVGGFANITINAPNGAQLRGWSLLGEAYAPSTKMSMVMTMACSQEYMDKPGSIVAYSGPLPTIPCWLGVANMKMDSRPWSYTLPSPITVTAPIITQVRCRGANGNTCSYVVTVYVDD